MDQTIFQQSVRSKPKNAFHKLQSNRLSSPLKDSSVESSVEIPTTYSANHSLASSNDNASSSSLQSDLDGFGSAGFDLLAAMRQKTTTLVDEVGRSQRLEREANEQQQRELLEAQRKKLQDKQAKRWPQIKDNYRLLGDFAVLPPDMAELVRQSRHYHFSKTHFLTYMSETFRFSPS